MQIIADAGATSTEWRIRIHDGLILNRRTDGLNFAVGRGSDSSLIDLRMSLVLPEDEISEIWFYGAGLVSADVCDEWENNLVNAFQCSLVHIESDLTGAARAVLGNMPGIACILGTGSNSCLWDGERIVTNVHSGGYVLGDEGSGAYIGRMLLSDFIKGLTPEQIGGTLTKRYGLDYGTIVKCLYQGTAPSRYLASFAPFIRENINHPYCRDLVSCAFDAFIQRNILPYGKKKPTLAFVGSIADVFRDILKERVEAAGYVMGEVMASPADGLIRYHFGL